MTNSKASITNSKLHCCLIVLILFILVFLSIPLLLIYLANNNYETNLEQQQQQHIIEPQQTSQTLVSTTTKQSEEFGCPPSNRTDGQPVHCPDGLFPCASCPDICIKQDQNCNGVKDCPGGTDESSLFCYDSHGAMKNLYTKIYESRRNKTKHVNVIQLARPESCDYEAFVQELCPCNMSEERVIICDGFGLTIIPNNLHPTVFKVRLMNNQIESINNVKWPRELISLVLLNNQIKRLERGTFALAPKLSKLYLSNNQLEYLDRRAFENASSLTSVTLDSNKLQTFDTKILLDTPLVSVIHLNDNQIDLPNDAQFSLASSLRELWLDHNRINIIRRNYFSNMKRLYWLSLTNNEISYIEPYSFEFNFELGELNLSFNKLKTIDKRMFATRLNIQRLYLSGNPLKTLTKDAFNELMELKSLNLTQINFDHLNRETFASHRLHFIYFEKFRYCHYASHVSVCKPITDGLSSKDELLAFPILKYAVWIVALVCSLGNVFVLIWRSVSPRENKTLSLFVKNLSIADLLMGVYLCTIGYQDWWFEKKFGSNALEWMASWKCTAIGFLAIFSSELSVFLLLIITIERYRSIMSIRPCEPAEQQRRAYMYITLAWFLSFCIAFYPLATVTRIPSPQTQSFQQQQQQQQQLQKSAPDSFYATNYLCLPLHINPPFTSGWLYSAFIYVGINFSAVLVIIALYAHMYKMIVDGRQLARPCELFRNERREDTILAVRFFFIVVTDCLCWIPIVVIKIIALFDYNISTSIYGWLVVFIIPINSALNPIVYTLAAPTTLRSIVCRLFERLCYRFDQLTRHPSNTNTTPRSSLASATNTDDHNVQSAPSSLAPSAGILALDPWRVRARAAAARARRRRHRTRKPLGSISTSGDTNETSVSGATGSSSASFTSSTATGGLQQQHQQPQQLATCLSDDLMDMPTVRGLVAGGDKKRIVASSRRSNYDLGASNLLLLGGNNAKLLVVNSRGTNSILNNDNDNDTDHEDTRTQAKPLLASNTSKESSFSSSSRSSSSAAGSIKSVDDTSTPTTTSNSGNQRRNKSPGGGNPAHSTTQK